MSMTDHLRSVVSLLVIILNLSVALVAVLLLALAKLVAPARERALNVGLATVYRWAVRVDDWWLQRVMGATWPRPDLNLAREGRYLVISNHRSWADIFLIQSVLLYQGPPVKFLVKESLRYVPILAQIFWAYRFPIVRRATQTTGNEQGGQDQRRQRDLDAVAAACDALSTEPAALLSFVEGTRFSAEKQALRGADFKQLLAPRAGGLGVMIDSLRAEIDGLIDLTLMYPGDASFWRFLAGRSGRIEVRATFTGPPSLPEAGDTRGWLNRRWRDKDAEIDAWQGDST